MAENPIIVKKYKEKHYSNRQALLAETSDKIISKKDSSSPTSNPTKNVLKSTLKRKRFSTSNITHKLKHQLPHIIKTLSRLNLYMHVVIVTLISIIDATMKRNVSFMIKYTKNVNVCFANVNSLRFKSTIIHIMIITIHQIVHHQDKLIRIITGMIRHCR